MKKNTDRTFKIAEYLHRGIASLIRDELNDPRIGMVTVIDVEVSRDLAHAKIFVSVLEETKIAETLHVLNNAAGFFRRRLAETGNLRIVPKLRFVFDESVIKGNRIHNLLSKVLPKSPASDDDV